jgi:uncharacterized membrane protein
MSFTAELIPNIWLWMAHLLYGFLLLWALKQAPWHHLTNAHDTHVLLGSCLILWLVWRASAGVTVGMEFHLLLVTTITLMFGWHFAIICVSLAQLGITLEGQAQWASYSLNTLCNGLVPIGVTYGIYWLAYLWLPRHFFIYIYMTAFAGGALAMLISRLVGMAILLGSGAYQITKLANESLFIIIMLFPEAFINGILITVLVVYRPQWVASFSDKQYLDGK